MELSRYKERCKHSEDCSTEILHVSEAEVKEIKMMEHAPIIIVTFQTQQVYCVRDRNGDVTDGGNHKYKYTNFNIFNTKGIYLKIKIFYYSNN
ncbi:unnamed protein product [Malus baccata var. baccata]